MTAEINSNINGEDLQSYFIVLERPTVSPGHCIVCGNTQRPVVMLKVEVDYADLGYGALLLCIMCVTQAASRFAPAPITTPGTTPEEFDRWKQGLLDDVRSYITTYAVDNLAKPVYGNSDSVLEQAKPEDSPAVESDTSESSGTGEQADGSTSSEGPFSFSSHPSDGKPISPFGSLRSE